MRANTLEHGEYLSWLNAKDKKKQAANTGNDLTMLWTNEERKSARENKSKEKRAHGIECDWNEKPEKIVLLPLLMPRHTKSKWKGEGKMKKEMKKKRHTEKMCERERESKSQNALAVTIK